MSKIYETTADWDRENLAKKIDERRESQRMLFHNGVAASALGTALLEVSSSRQLKAAQTGKEVGAGRVTRLLGWAGIGMGIASLVASFFAGNKAKEIRSQMDDLGPQRIVLPDEVYSQIDALGEGQGEYARRLEMYRHKLNASVSRVI